MKPRFYMYLFWYLTAICRTCFGQDSSSHQTVFPPGIDLQFGAGYLAVRDENLSDEKYEGSSSGFALQWSHYHETYGFRITMFRQQALRIRNYNVSAEATQSGFNFVNLYPAGTFDLFNKRAFVFLGPCVDIFIYNRLQNIALNYSYKSDARLYFLGVRAEAIMPLGGLFQVEGAVQLSLISVGNGSSNAANSGTTKLLMAWDGFRGHAEIGVRYYPIKRVSLRTGYAIEITRINSWNYILESVDNAFLSLAYHF